jgi:hypothetical protein
MRDDVEVANNLLAKVRSFVSAELDDEESEMFASLLAPGVSLAYAEDEVAGFEAADLDDEGGLGVAWHPGALAEALGAALRESGVRVVGL